MVPAGKLGIAAQRSSKFVPAVSKRTLLFVMKFPKVTTIVNWKQTTRRQASQSMAFDSVLLVVLTIVRQIQSRTEKTELTIMQSVLPLLDSMCEGSPLVGGCRSSSVENTDLAKPAPAKLMIWSVRDRMRMMLTAILDFCMLLLQRTDKMMNNCNTRKSEFQRLIYLFCTWIQRKKFLANECFGFINKDIATGAIYLYPCVLCAQLTWIGLQMAQRDV